MTDGVHKAVTKDEKKQLWGVICDKMKETGNSLIDQGVVDENRVSPWKLADAIITSMRDFCATADLTAAQLEEIMKKAKEIH